MRLGVVSKYPPGMEGIAEYARHVVGSLANRPEIDQVTVIANREADDSARGGGPIDVRRVWQAGDPGLPFRILREIRIVKPHAIWYNVGLSMFGGGAFSLPGFALPAITRRLGIPSVVTLHEQRIKQIAELGLPDRPWQRAGLQSALQLLLMSDVVCVTTAAHRRALARRRLPGRARLVHVPLCGYGDPTLDPFPAQPTVLMLTSHAPHKNLPLLLDAFRRVRQRIPAVCLVVAGIDHPRYPGYLAEVRQRHGSEPGVEWTGPIETRDLRATFSRATVTVVPYRATAGSSATVHQAINVGRPVVAADLPELRSMAAEEDLWIEFFRPNNPDQLAEALEALLTNPSRCTAIARHNLRSAQQNSLAATTECYLQLFQGLPGSEHLPTRTSGSASGAPSL